MVKKEYSGRPAQHEEPRADCRQDEEQIGRCRVGCDRDCVAGNGMSGAGGVATGVASGTVVFKGRRGAVVTAVGGVSASMDTLLSGSPRVTYTVSPGDCGFCATMENFLSAVADDVRNPTMATPSISVVTCA